VFREDAINISETFGQYLRGLRKKKGLTLKELGELTDFSYSYLSQLERGERGGTKKIPSPEVLERLSGPLDVNILELYRKAGYIKNAGQLEYGVDSNEEVEIIRKLPEHDRNLIKKYASGREFIEELLKINPPGLRGFWEQNKDIFDNHELTIDLLDRLVKTRRDESVNDLLSHLIVWSRDYIIEVHDGNESRAYTRSHWFELEEYLRKPEVTYKSQLITPEDRQLIITFLDVLFKERLSNNSHLE